MIRLAEVLKDLYPTAEPGVDYVVGGQPGNQFIQEWKVKGIAQPDVAMLRAHEFVVARRIKEAELHAAAEAEKTALLNDPSLTVREKVSVQRGLGVQEKLYGRLADLRNANGSSAAVESVKW